MAGKMISLHDHNGKRGSIAVLKLDLQTTNPLWIGPVDMVRRSAPIN